jgi:hypothetical protein
MTKPSAFREWLLERTGNHAKDIGEANRFADEIEQLRGNLSLAENGLAAAMQEIEQLKGARAQDQQRLFHLENALASGPAAEPFEHPILMEDRAYYDGARQAAAMAHQSLKSMDEWIAGGCGNRVPAVKSNVCTCGRQATGDHEPGCAYRPDWL